MNNSDQKNISEMPLSAANEDKINALSPSYRQMPHNIEAEQALLGAILVNNTAAEKISGFLREEHFFEPVHGRIFAAIHTLSERGQTADPVKLKPYFEKDEALKDIGGASYLARLASSATTIINAEDYGRTIYDLFLRRELVAIGESVVLTAYDSPIDDPAISQIEGAEKELFDLAEKGSHEGGFQNFSLSMQTAVEFIEIARKSDGSLSGVTTGLRDMNRLIGGMHKSDLMILAARPGMGKTALATNVAFSAALQYAEDVKSGMDMKTSKGAVVGFFSLEMSADQLASRILAERSGMSSHKLRRGELSDEEFLRLVRATQELESVPFFIDDTPGLDIAGLRSRARRLKRQKNLGLVVVDYLQLLRASGRGKGPENRVQEVSEITRGLKGLAKELQVPVLALSQLSRQVESREDKRPMLSDLRESGSIEQDADMVMFIYRDEYYEKNKKQPEMGTEAHKEWQNRQSQVHNIAELIIAKQRHGPTDTIQLHFEGETTKFSDLAKEDYLPEKIE
jgi:replicative DNA helicase